MRKKVLLVTPYFYPEGGGLENYAFQIASKMPDYFFYVACLSKQNSHEVKGNLIIHRYKAQFIFSNTPLAIFFIFKLLHLIKQEKIELIHAHTPVPYAADCAALAGQLTGVPLIITYHSANLFKQRRIIDLIIRGYIWMEQFCLRQAKQIILVSPHIAMEKRIKKYENKLAIITPGVDPGQFKPCPYQAGHTLLFIGALKKACRGKGLTQLLEALQIVKYKKILFKLKIIGVKGDDYEYYTELIKRYNLEQFVEFLGQLNPEQLIIQYQQCQAVIIPSAANSEGMPTVMFEAGAIGRPILASATSGIPYVIKSGINGLLFPPGSVPEIAKTIISFLSQPDQAQIMAEQANKIVGDYDWAKLAKQYEQIYQKYI